MFDQVLARVCAQQEQIVALDSKANFGLGSSTLLTIIVGLINRGNIVWWLLAIAMIAYIYTVVWAFQGYKVKPFVRAGSPEVLIDSYLKADPDQSKEAFLNELREEYKINAALINDKTTAVKCVVQGVLYQAIILAILVVASVLL